MESKRIGTDELTSKTKVDSDIKNELMVTKGESCGRGINSGFDISIYTTIYKIDDHEGPTVWQRELYTLFYTNYKRKKRIYVCVFVYVYV